MNHIYRIATPLLFLLFLSCLDKNVPPVVVTVDGNSLRSNEFFSTINRKEFFKQRLTAIQNELDQAIEENKKEK